jgi:hypothetical protein
VVQEEEEGSRQEKRMGYRRKSKVASRRREPGIGGRGK